MASKTFLSAKDAKYQSLLDISKKIYPEKPYLLLQKEVTDTWVGPWEKVSQNIDPSENHFLSLIINTGLVQVH